MTDVPPWERNQQGSTAVPTQMRPDLQDAFEVDFSEASEGFYVPEGTYMMMLIDMQPGTSKTGNPKFALTFEIQGPSERGQKIQKHAPATGQGSGILRTTLKALRPDVDLPKGRVAVRPSEYLGRLVTAVVRDRGYKDDDGQMVISSEIKTMRPYVEPKVPQPQA